MELLLQDVNVYSHAGDFVGSEVVLILVYICCCYSDNRYADKDTCMSIECYYKELFLEL